MPRTSRPRHGNKKLATKELAKKIEEELDDLSSDMSDDLRKKGIYYITGEIDTDSLLDIHQDILGKHLNTRWKRSLEIFVNSVGGDAAEGWMLIDLIEHIRMSVKTIGMGECCSLGSMILAAGTPGRRLASRNATIMIHGFSVGLYGSYRQLANEMLSVEQEHKREANFWLRVSNLSSIEEVENKLLDGNDHYLTAQQALELGIIDEIIEPKKTCV